MTRCPPDALLKRLLAGGLDAVRTDALEAHLSGCPTCCRRLDALTEAASVRRAPKPSAGPRVSVASPAADPLPTVPGYAFIRELGRGGMGAVYLATQEALNRPVALKALLAREFAGAVARKRFLAEAHAIARVRHPGVVEVFDYGTTPSGVAYLAMEFVAGGSLAAFARGEPVAPRAAARFVADLADAVGAAHAAGIIHRDLKPSNILLAARPPAPPADHRPRRDGPGRPARPLGPESYRLRVGQMAIG